MNSTHLHNMMSGNLHLYDEWVSSSLSGLGGVMDVEPEHEEIPTVKTHLKPCPQPWRNPRILLSRIDGPTTDLLLASVLLIIVPTSYAWQGLDFSLQLHKGQMVAMDPQNGFRWVSWEVQITSGLRRP